MPIKSYLAHPAPGKKAMLMYALNSMSECEIVPAQNQDLLVLVTETKNKSHEQELEARLNELDSLAMLSLVSGFNDTTSSDA